MPGLDMPVVPEIPEIRSTGMTIISYLFERATKPFILPNTLQFLTHHKLGGIFFRFRINIYI